MSPARAASALRQPWSRAAGTPVVRMRRGSPRTPFKGGFRVLITGSQGFERTVVFGLDDEPAVIAERVRETMEE